jgi:hypothetical protein
MYCRLLHRPLASLPLLGVAGIASLQSRPCASSRKESCRIVPRHCFLGCVVHTVADDISATGVLSKQRFPVQSDAAATYQEEAPPSWITAEIRGEEFHRCIVINFANSVCHWESAPFHEFVRADDLCRWLDPRGSHKKDGALLVHDLAHL